MTLRILTVAAVAALALATVGAADAQHYVPHKQSFGTMTTKQRAGWLERQAQHDRGAIRWIDRHLSRPFPERFILSVIFLRPHIRAERRWFATSLRITTRNLERAQAELAVEALPAHHALWMCIHSHEAADWQNRDTGGNGHFGGLQMHPGWGYGTSYFASDDSQLVQEQAAERGFAANGYSTSWLMGQWYHPDCLAYA